MNTPVSFELAKLLKEKGFDTNVGTAFKYTFEKGHIKDDYMDTASWNDISGVILAPTIAEVVMWLYEEHGVWIRVEPDWDGDFWAQIKSKNIPDARIGKWMVVNAFAPYKTPTEAYEAAIEYTLKTLVP